MEARYRKTLCAAIDRIIPRDDYPSASENDVDDFIDTLTTTNLQSWRAALLEGLNALDEAARGVARNAFADLTAPQQDDLLRLFEQDPARADWFQTLVRITNEGYYTDPSRGSNLGQASWKMIGYDLRIPRERR